MADFIQAPFKTESDIRLFILYLLDAIGLSLDFVDFHDIVVQNGLVKSFDFCLALPELVKSGHIRLENRESDGTELYSISPLGHDAVETLAHTLLHGTREKTLQNARILLQMKKTHTDYRCATEELPDGRYRFTARFLHKYEEVLSVSAIFDTKQEAERAQLNFDMRPDVFRRSLLSLLNNRYSVFNGENPLLS